MGEARTPGDKNAQAYREGMRDAADGWLEPRRRMPTEEEQIAYGMGFYEESEALEDGEEG